ncbi:MAG: cysteine desulfurase, partial [Saprospiraceae bacterium]|nr:cysteine desulfurase [Saprospiraceae bacterium]
MKRVFLDNAATTTLHPEVIEAMLDAMDGRFGNPSSIHAEGRAARAALEQARKTVARYIGASIGEVFFTSGGTESNNMALKCAVRDLGVVRIISSPTEHHCVLHSLETIERSGKARIDFVEVDAKGHVVMSHLEKLLQEDAGKTLVSLMHSNNEIGSMIDLEEISGLCQRYHALFHTDTVQTMGYFPINVGQTPINFLSGSAHKFHGPKGVGFVYINKENIVRPFVDGGSQERNMRGGTENFYGIIGLAKALQIACDNMESNRLQITTVRNYFADQLR